jgi:ABC-type transport system involved in multi-copper enzyme maturation permease subunit
MIRVLLWKEWHEHKMRLLLACIVMGLFTGATYLQFDRKPVDTMNTSILLGAILLPIFIAMGLIAPERSQRTLGTLIVLPVRPWMIVMSKAVFGALCVVLPVVICTVPLYMIAHDAMKRDMLETLWLEISIALIMLTWTAALAARQPTATRVGLVGIGIAIGSLYFNGMIHMFHVMDGGANLLTWCLILLAYMSPLSPMNSFMGMRELDPTTVLLT